MTRTVIPWPDTWKGLAETTIEDGEWADTFSMWAGLPVTQFCPQAIFVRILLAVAMRPEECQRRDAHGKLVDVPEHVPDPLETSVTTIYQHALTLLHTWLAYDGLPVLQALPGYSEASRYEIGEVKDVSHKDANKFRATLGERPKDSNSKGRKSGQASPSTEYGSLEDDSLPRKAAQKVANCLDIWEVLGGVPFETDDDADEESFVAPRGWQLLEVLIEAWKLDAQQYPQLGWSPHLLRQFRQREMASRSLRSTRALGIVFSPYKTAVGSEEAGLLREKLSADLMRLIGDLAAAGKVDRADLVRQISDFVRDLRMDQLVRFLSTQHIETSIFRDVLSSLLDEWSMDPSGPAPQHPVSSLEYKMSLIASSDVSLEDEDAAVAGPSKQAAIKLAYLKNALASRNTAADSINRADLRKALQQSCPSCPEAEALHQIALQLLAQTP